MNFKKYIEFFIPLQSMKRIQTILGAILPYLIFLILLPISIIIWGGSQIFLIIQRIFPTRNERGK